MFLGWSSTKIPAEALNGNILYQYESHPDVWIAIKMVYSIEDAHPS